MALPRARARVVVALCLATGCARDGLPAGAEGPDAEVPENLDLSVAARPPDLTRPCTLPDSDRPLFAPPVDSPLTAEAAFDIQIADFDRDGRPDVVVGNGQQAAASVLLNLGGGRLGPPGVLLDAADDSSRLWHYVAAGDLDGDEWPDLVVTRGGFPESGIAVHINAAGGGFARPVSYTSRTLGLGYEGIAIADLSGDGKLDVAAIDGRSGFEFVNRGDGTLDTPIRWPTQSGGAAAGLVLADLNRDGKPDFVIANYQANEVALLLSQRLPGIYDTARSFPCGLNPWNLATGDLDGDGATDVVVGNEDDLAGGISVLYNRGDGTLEAPVHHHTSPNTMGVAIGDVDGDGRLDIVADRHPVSIFLHRGARAFVLAETLARGGALTLADMNGDGKLDVVAASGKTVSVYLNQRPDCR